MWCGEAKLLDMRKPRTEVAPETTTPTRLWGSLGYGSQNPMQQLHSKALVATGPARPTTPSNSCGPTGSAYRFPSASPCFLPAPAQRQVVQPSCLQSLRPHSLLLCDYYRFFNGLECIRCLPFEMGLQVEIEGESARVGREDSAGTGPDFLRMRAPRVGGLVGGLCVSGN